MYKYMSIVFMGLLLFLLGLVGQKSFASSEKSNKSKLSRNFKEQVVSEKITKSSQVEVDKIYDEQSQTYESYKRTLQKIKNAKIYNAQLQKLIIDQNKEKVSLDKQIESLKETNEGVVPFMLTMLSTLEKMVLSDTPFLPEERKKRVDELKKMMNRADVSTSEKFRRILEAYQVENEYGRTLEAYQGSLLKEGKKLTVDFLRVGRVALIYQTLDRKKTGIWDKEKSSWVELDSDYRNSILKGLKVARKQMAPEILDIPLKNETESMTKESI